MFAIVEIAGKQYKVSENDKVEVDRLPQEKGKISLDKVLLYSKDPKSVEVGTPYLNGAIIEAEILEHTKDEKIRVFKMKPKKRYQRTYGHRKHLTVLEIKSITFTKKATPKKAEPKKEEEVKEKAVKAETGKEVKATEKAPKVAEEKKEMKAEDKAAPKAPKATAAKATPNATAVKKQPKAAKEESKES